jgi:GDPmannose 4,6-dehydratase
MFRIMQLENPDDYVISSGEVHTVGEFVEGVFGYLELDWKIYVKENPGLIRKKPKNNLFGNPGKLKRDTGWEPQKSFRDWIRIMVDDELKKYESK